MFSSAMKIDAAKLGKASLDLLPMTIMELDETPLEIERQRISHVSLRSRIGLTHSRIRKLAPWNPKTPERRLTDRMLCVRRVAAVCAA